MNHSEINKFFEAFDREKKEKTIVIVDFGNVIKWQESLGWRIGIKQLGQLVKIFSTGKIFLRRFYYGMDCGRKERKEDMLPWSERMLDLARMNKFQIITKCVKYIRDVNYKTGYIKKCDFDVEMAVDLVKEKNNYDTIILFSGDGDLMYVVKYLVKQCDKECYVFGARDHVGKEIFDAKQNNIIEKILYFDDLEYRLSMDRFFK